MKKVLLLLAFVMSNFAQAQAPIQNFLFNNSLMNSTSDLSLTGTNFSYQADRNGTPNNALRLVGGPDIISYATGNIINIPVGNTQRTVSFWAKVDYNGVDPSSFFAYGSAANNQAFGFNIWLSTQRRLIRYAWGASATFDNIIPNTYSYFNWNHYAITYDGISMKTYVNGQLMFINPLSSINTVGTNLNIGKSLTTSNYTLFGFDDFQIYDVALNDAQISHLYVENNFNLGVVAPTITSVSSGTLNANDASLNFSVHARGAATTYLIRYGLSPTNLTNVENGNSNTNLYENKAFTQVIGGLNRATTYYYRIEATNSAGTTLSNVENFTTFGTSIVHEFKFNNSTYDETNNLFFYAPTVATNLFTTDRFGNANSALTKRITGIYQADINELPTGNTPRTISIWIKPSSVNSDNIIFTYGLDSGIRGYGASFTATNTFNFTLTNNLVFANTTAANAWKHIVVTFDASQVAKIYIDGVLGSQGSFPTWSTNSTSKFYLGNYFGSATGGFIGAIDDLKIYHRALTAAEVMDLHASSTLSSFDFSQNNLKVALYPNPVKDVLNIETETEIKSVEIYNLLGQKVKTATIKQVSVFDLQAGSYLVRVQDTNNAVETMKFVKQ